MLLQSLRRLLDDSATEPPIMGDYEPPQQGGAGGFTHFQPSLAVVLGVLTIMFTLTFALLLYAKCCHRDASTATRPRSSLFSSSSIHSNIGSGLTKKSIDSLPFFRFGTLKGSKDDLECSVCLSKYEPSDLLRLLPKCRHAFHIDCVDQWLFSSATCPLCRANVAPEDAELVNTGSSRLVLQDQDPDPIGAEEIEVVVEREVDRVFSFRRLFGKEVHKHKHKMVVSDVVLKSRWSNVSSSDIMFLSSERVLSSDRFLMNPCGGVEGRRSVSEITVLSRFYKVPVGGGGREEEKRRRWMPIARKTVDWLASREGTQCSGNGQALNFV